MDDDRSQIPRPSGLPRLSRLPVISSVSTTSTSVPISTTSRPMSILPHRSRDNLPGASAGELRNPKMRSAASRDRLSLGAPATAAKPPALAPPPTGTFSVLKGASRNPTPRSRAVSGQYIPAPARAPASRASLGATVPAPSLLRQSSRSQLVQPLDNPHQPLDDGLEQANVSAVPPELPRARPAKPRPSLSDRTIETLAQIPSSPAVKGRPSAFFDVESARFPSQRPTSRAGASSSRPGSRPGSSYASDNSSGQSTSHPPSRPASRSRSGSVHDDCSVPNLRASFRSAAPSSFVPIDELGSSITRPSAGRTLRSRVSIGPGIVTGHQNTRQGDLRQQADASAAFPRSRTPSPEKNSAPIAFSTIVGTRTPSAPGQFTSKPPTTLPLKPRVSIGGPVQKPTPVKKRVTSTSQPTPKATRKSSLTSRASSTSYEESNPSRASTVSTAPSMDLADSGATGPAPASTSRKSSAALREQIAKAKAAKRAVSQQQTDTSEATVSATSVAKPRGLVHKPSFSTSFPADDEMPVVPTDTTFDFGLNTDPFSQKRNDQTLAKVIQSRVATARTSGRLNIAALSLRDIPMEVMNMYDAESMGTYDGSWAESVDLTRFVAADNEIEMLDESVFPDLSPEELAENEDGRGNIFGGLETLDLHGNMLISLPMGLRQLTQLTALNLSQNRITNNALEVISQITSLRDLKLGGNLFYGPLDPCFAKLCNLEIADLHGNNISALPLTMANMTKLRILNISENNFESLVFEPLAKLPLTELLVRKNRISGVLIEDAVPSLPNLQILDVTSNQITHLVSSTRPKALGMPALQQLLVAMNRLQELPELGDWSNLLTLIAEENSINSIPGRFTELNHLRHADFSSNDIRAIPAEVGRMDNLAILRLSGNPLRDKKFCTATTDEVKYALAARLESELEPEPVRETCLEPGQGSKRMAGGELTSFEPGITPAEMKDELRDAVTELASSRVARDESTNHSDDDVATPSSSRSNASARSRSLTPSSQTWPVKLGGVLDRSETGSSALHPVVASRVAQEHAVREIFLHRNLFTALPDSLSFFSATLTVLSLARNQLTGETYLGDSTVSEGLFLPVLNELNLSSNHITGLGPLVRHLHAPVLQKLDVSMNRISSLPVDGQLRTAFPELTILHAGNNHLAELDPESIRGLRIVDVSNNDIEHLNPRLGLLGGSAGLERLEVMGNRFRVPRFNVIERGTEATLRWLRGRVPVAEMGAWREANRQNEEDDCMD